MGRRGAGHLARLGELQISVVDYDGALVRDATPLGVTAFDFGNPICTDDMCTMLFTTSELDGPTLGRIDFSIAMAATSLTVHNVSLFDGQDVHGRVGMAVAAPQGLRAIAGRHWVEFGVAFDAGIEPAVPVLTLLTEWPLGIGAVVDGHRLLLPLTVECGNQVVQGSEACDDGNLDVGDGCDACMIELEGGLDDLRFDDVGEDVGDCSCRTDAPGRGIAEPLLGWLVLGGARRRLARS